MKYHSTRIVANRAIVAPREVQRHEANRRAALRSAASN
jgi:hypothetical protein